jgi:hypothetical protein
MTKPPLDESVDCDADANSERGRDASHEKRREVFDESIVSEIRRVKNRSDDGNQSTSNGDANTQGSYNGHKFNERPHSEVPLCSGSPTSDAANDLSVFCTVAENRPEAALALRECLDLGLSIVVSNPDRDATVIAGKPRFRFELNERLARHLPAFRAAQIVERG